MFGGARGRFLSRPQLETYKNKPARSPHDFALSHPLQRLRFPRSFCRRPRSSAQKTKVKRSPRSSAALRDPTAAARLPAAGRCFPSSHKPEVQHELRSGCLPARGGEHFPRGSITQSPFHGRSGPGTPHRARERAGTTHRPRGGDEQGRAEPRGASAAAGRMLGPERVPGNFLPQVRAALGRTPSSTHRPYAEPSRAVLCSALPCRPAPCRAVPCPSPAARAQCAPAPSPLRIGPRRPHITEARRGD